MVDLLQIVQNVVNAISPGGGGMTGFFYALSWLIGLLFVMMAIRGFATRSEMGKQGGSWSSPFWGFIIGICFVALPGFIESMTLTIFSSQTPDAEAIFSYAPATVGLFDSDSPSRKILVGIVTIIQFLGVVAIMRGLFLLRETSQGRGGGPSTFGPGITFVIAGVLCVNFPMAVGVVEKLLTSN